MAANPQHASNAEDFAREALLIQRLRDALPPDTRAGFFREFDELLSIAADPRCAEAQADGVPCGTADSNCEDCGRAIAWLARLRAEIAKATP
jgi:hypothetical protein